MVAGERGTRAERAQGVQPVGQLAPEALERVGAGRDIGKTVGAGLHGRSIASGEPSFDEVLRAGG